jgi:hypothetical protein
LKKKEREEKEGDMDFIGGGEERMIIQMDLATEIYDLASRSGLRTAIYDRESQARGNPALEKTFGSPDRGLAGLDYNLDRPFCMLFTFRLLTRHKPFVHMVYLER